MRAEEPAVKDQESLRRDRNEAVSQIIRRMEAKRRSGFSSYDETADIEAMARIRRQLQSRSSVLSGSEVLVCFILSGQI